MSYSLTMKIPTYYKGRFYDTEDHGEIVLTADTYEEICEQANKILVSQSCANEIITDIIGLQSRQQHLKDSISNLEEQFDRASAHVNTFKAWLKAVGIDSNRSPISISMQALLDHSDPSLFELEPASIFETDVISSDF